MHRVSSVPRQLVYAVLLALVCAPFAVDAQRTKTFKVEARVYCVKPDRSRNTEHRAMNVSANTIGTSGPNVFYIEESGEIELSGISLRIKDGNATWTSSPAKGPDAVEPNDAGSPEEPDPDRVVIIARPSIITPAGEQSKIELVQPIQSFVRREDGTFELQTYGNTGVTFACTITPQRDPGRVTIDWQSTHKRIAGREEISGVSLPIGPPIVSVDTMQQEMDVKLGAWCGIVQIMPDQNVFVSLVRATTWTGERE